MIRGAIVCTSAKARNDHLEFSIPYEYPRRESRLFPGLHLLLTVGSTLLLEIKGLENDQDRAKHQATKRWLAAVNHWSKLLFQVCRHEPKNFSQRRPDPTALDGWIWNVKGVKRVLFRLPDVIREIVQGRPVFVCEGEKDVLEMVEQGFAATAHPGGANREKPGCNWLPDYSETLRGAEVVLI